jgi:hypothetical protein
MIKEERRDIDLKGIDVFGQELLSLVSSPEVDEIQNIRFTVNSELGTKVLLLRLQEILKQERAPEKPTQGATIREALKLLAEKIDYPKLEKKYKRFVSHITADYVLNGKKENLR